MTTEERLALFDANMKWLDELQAEELKEAKAKGTRITVGTAAGPAKNSTTTTVDCLVATLVDTNVLVYLCDPRDLWAYAEHYGLPEILSEDFHHGRMYGTVTIRNPFIELGLS